MSVERLDADRVGVAGGDEAGIAKYIESDFRIRSGICPNGHGLLDETYFGQSCATCGFWTNKPAEKVMVS